MRLTDKAFQYTPSHSTDIAKRFRKVMAEQKRAAEQAKADEAERKDKLVPMKRRAT